MKSPTWYYIDGARLRSARQSKGYSQIQLADAAGVAQSSIANWEHDRSRIRRDSLALIAEALDVAPDSLIQ